MYIYIGQKGNVMPGIYSIIHFFIVLLLLVYSQKKLHNLLPQNETECNISGTTRFSGGRNILAHLVWPED